MNQPSWMWIVIIVSAIWVYYDAKTIGVRKGLITGLGNMGPMGWAVVTVGLWIVGFPMYLIKRQQFKAAVARETEAPAPFASRTG